VVPSSWTAPATVAADEREAAAELLAWLLRHDVPASRDDMRGFVTMIGMACAGALTKEEATAKTATYLALLDEVPLGVVKRREVERRAARAFKFFPTFQELDAFLVGETKMFRASIKRLQVVVDLPEAVKAPRQQLARVNPIQAKIDAMSDAERDALRELRRRYEAGEIGLEELIRGGAR